MANPAAMTAAVVIIVVGCFAVCAMGLEKGVEKVTKWMMLCLFGIMLVLVGNSLLMDGAKEGLKFYLYPDFGKLMEAGIFNAIFDAMILSPNSTGGLTFLGHTVSSKIYPSRLHRRAVSLSSPRDEA